VTPPLGSACFIVTGIARIRIVDMMRPMLPFMAVMFATVIPLAYVPASSEWLPACSAPGHVRGAARAARRAGRRLTGGAAAAL
jgi:hypothetical protein